MADDKTDSGSSDAAPAVDVIQKFGGIRPMASKLGIAVTTVQGWKERGVIPAPRHKDVLAAAAEHGIAITADDLVAGDLQEEKGAAAKATAAAPPSASSGSSGRTDAPPEKTGQVPKSGSSVPPVKAPPEKSDTEKEAAAKTSAASGAASKSPPPPPPKSPPPKKKSGGFMRKAITALILIGVLAGAGSWGWWKYVEPGVYPWQSAMLGLGKTDAEPKQVATGTSGKRADDGAASSVRKPGDATRTLEKKKPDAPKPALKDGETATAKAKAEEKKEAEERARKVGESQAGEGAEKDKISGFKKADDGAGNKAAAGGSSGSSGATTGSLAGSAGNAPTPAKPTPAKPTPAKPTPAKPSAGLKREEAEKKPGAQPQPQPKAEGETAEKKEPPVVVPPPAPVESAEAKAAREELQKEVKDLRDANAGLVAALKATQDRLAKLEKQFRSTGAPEQTTLALAAGQLRDAVLKGRPFVVEMKVLSGMAAESPDNTPAEVTAALKVLEPHALAGVKTEAALRASFEETAWAAVRAGRMPDDPGLSDKVLGKLSDVFAVRRTGGDTAGDSAEAIVARAEARVKAGDLTGAVTELAKLEGRAAKAAEGWLTAARARLAADEAIDAISRAAIASLAGANTGGSGSSGGSE